MLKSVSAIWDGKEDAIVKIITCDLCGAEEKTNHVGGKQGFKSIWFVLKENEKIVSHFCAECAEKEVIL